MEHQFLLSPFRAVWQRLKQRQSSLEVGDRFLIGEKMHGSLASLMQIGYRLRHTPRCLEVPCQLYCDLLRLLAVDRLEDIPDILVEIYPLRCVQMAVEISLEQEVPEAIA